MNSEDFKNYAQGLSGAISALAIIVAGGFAFYKFVWTEQSASETSLANLVGATRAQVSVSSTIEVNEIFVNSDAEDAAAHNLTAMHYCPEGEDDTAECRNKWQTVEVPRLDTYDQQNCRLNDDDKWLRGLVSAWNIVFEVSLENRSTVPIDFQWKELKIFEAENLRTFGDSFDQTEDVGQLKSIPIREIHSEDDLSGLFFGESGTEIGVGYENSMTAIGKMWLPFACGQSSMTILFRFVADVQQISAIDATEAVFQKTEKTFVHLCELSRTPERYSMWHADCGEYVRKFYSQ